jgi:hypothetical protein
MQDDFVGVGQVDQVVVVRRTFPVFSQNVVCRFNGSNLRQEVGLKLGKNEKNLQFCLKFLYNKTSFLVQIKFITEDSKWFIYKY